MDGIAALLAPLMLLALVPLLLVGLPSAFALAGCALAFAWAGIEAGVVPPRLLHALPLRLFGLAAHEALRAIPFLVLMGLVLQRARLLDALLAAAGAVLGRVRGGLALAVVGVGALQSAASGAPAATTASVSRVSVPALLQGGYDARIAGGVAAAAGSLAPAVPPSLALIVMAEQLGCSARELFVAMAVPAALLLAGYAAWIVALAPPARGPRESPSLPAATAWRAVATLALLLGVLGAIATGVATPAESAAVGAALALALAHGAGGLAWRDAGGCLRDTGRVTCAVMLLLFAAALFSLVFQALDGPRWAQRALASLPGGAAGFVACAVALVFLLGCVLGAYEIAFIALPVLGPLAVSLGIDLVRFGVLLALALQAAALAPPFAPALQATRDALARGRPAGPRVTASQLHAGARPFAAVVALVLALLLSVPALLPRERGTPAADEAAAERTLREEAGAEDAGPTQSALDLLREIWRGQRP